MQSTFSILSRQIPLKYSSFSWLFFIGYVLLLCFFSQIDIYHHDFYASGYTIVLYNVFRVFFILYLMWFCYIVGDYVLFLLTKESEYRNINLTATLLSFFIGLSVWHIVLLGIGFAGWYTRSFLSGLTLVLLTLSLPRVNQWVSFIRSYQKPFYLPGLFIISLPLFFFLLTKGLYPSGGHDYFTHYFPYYKEVTESGSLFPGRLWYHFYYDKGMGLFFLSMLLTDPLAPQLVTTAMIFASSAILFSLISRTSSWRLLPWIGVALYLFFLIYTPGPPEAVRETGWNELEKSHEPATLLLFAIIWMTLSLAQTNQQKVWRVALLLSTSALAIMSAATSMFAGVYLGCVMVCLFIFKKKSAAVSVAWGLFAMGTWLAVLLLINYLITGLPDEQSVLFWWPMVNFDKVNEWGGIFQVTNLYSARIADIARKSVINFDLIKKISTYLRFDIWGPLFFMVAISSIFNLNKLRSNTFKAQQAKIIIVFYSGFLLLIFGLSFFIGLDQPVSFYRFTSFTYAPTLCVCLLLLSLFLSDQKKWASLLLILAFFVAYSVIEQRFLPHYNKKMCLLMLLSFFLASIFYFYPSKLLRSVFFVFLAGYFTWITLHDFSFDNKNLFLEIKNASRFAMGRYSIAEAYRHQEGRPGAMAWGGIYPPVAKIAQQLPPRTRIWSWHIHSYCMIPDCDVEGFNSFQMSHHDEVVYFSDPQHAKEELQKDHLNYFFFSNQLDVRDPLILSSLFSPQHIADYLGILWTDGNNTLLTWKENARMPISTEWIKRYEKSNQPIFATFSYSNMKKNLNLAKL